MSGGKKKYKKAKTTYSIGDVKQIIRKTSDDATRRIMLLTVVAAQDECSLDADKVVALAERMQRYVKWENEGLVDLKVASESLYKNTGIDLRLTRW